MEEGQQMHRCGQCNQTFASEAEYLNHTCSELGVQPTDPRAMGADYEAIQQAALNRGKSRQEAEQNSQSSENVLQ